MQFANDGNIYVRTDRAGSPNGYTTSGYTKVGAYATGWAEFRIVYDFSAQTYTLSMRAEEADPWTQLKGATASGFDIPFRGANTITQTHGILFRAYQSTNMWLDYEWYGNAQFSINAVAGANGSIAPSGSQTYAYGSDSTSFTVTPNVGYVIADVLVDGSSVGTPAWLTACTPAGSRTWAWRTIRTAANWPPNTSECRR